MFSKPLKIIKDNPIFFAVMFPLVTIAADKQPQGLQSDLSVLTVTAPQSLPLEIITTLKKPRQPVPASDGGDYLKTIPGFSEIRNGGTNGDPVFRGMFGSRLRILVNDGEMLGACPARMDAPTSYISPESFDVLTMIKGPETVLWGPGNSAGTLRFERTPPQFEKAGIKGSASALVGSFNRHDENIDLNLGNQTGYLRLLGDQSRADDYKDGNGYRVPSHWDKWNGDIDLGFTPDNTTLIELTAGRGNGQARYAGRAMDGSQFKRDSLGIRFQKLDINDWFQKLESNFYYNYADHIMDNMTLRTPLMPMHASMQGMKMQLDRRTLGARLMATLSSGLNDIKIGADMQNSAHRSNQRVGWKKDAQLNDYGLFSEFSHPLSPQGKFVSGLRLDHAGADNSTGKGAASRTDNLYAGFLRYEYQAKGVPLVWYSGLGYTERFPDYWEFFSPTVGPRGQAPIDTLNTEKTTQLDLGVNYRGKQLESWASVFLGKVNDFILFNYDPLQPRVSRVSNVNATTYGGELGATWQFAENWKAESSLSYTWAENTDEHLPLPQIPPLETRFGLNWQSGNWSSAGLIRLVTAQHRTALNQGNVVGKDFNRASGFTIFSLNLAWQIMPRAKISAGIDNLFNKTYSEHLNLAGNSAFGYSADTQVNESGRNLWAKFNVTF